MIAKIIKRHKEAKSLYDDLGERECSRLTPLNRALERGPIDEKLHKEMLHFSVSKHMKRPPNGFERKYYPSKPGPDLVFSVPHNIKDKNGHLWGGDNTIKFHVVLSSHAQFRMDERCINLDQIKSTLKNFANEIKAAWHNKQYNKYTHYMRYLFEGTSRGEFISLDDVHLGVSPIHSSRHKEAVRAETPDGRTVLFPGSNEIRIQIATAAQDNRDAEGFNPKIQQCIAFLRSEGYSLKPKNQRLARMSRRASRLSIDLRGGFQTQSKTDLPKFYRINLSVDTALTPAQEEELKQIYARNLSTAKDAVVGNMPSLFVTSINQMFGGGIIELPSGLKFSIKQKSYPQEISFIGTRGGTFNLPIESRYNPAGVESKSKAGILAEYNIELELNSAPAPIAPPQIESPQTQQALTPHEQKIQKCISLLKDKFDITPPQD
jgi:hypothetical protein